MSNLKESIKKNKKLWLGGGIVLLLVLSVTLWAAYPRTTNKSNKEQDDVAVSTTEKKEVLKIGMVNQCPPYAQSGKKDSPNSSTAKNNGVHLSGTDLLLMREIAEETGLKIETHNYLYEGMVTAVQRGEIDGMMSAAKQTPERDQIMSPSIPYLSGKVGLVVKKNDPRYKDLDNYQEINKLDRLVKDANGNYHNQELKINCMISAQSKITVPILVKALQQQNPSVAQYIKEGEHQENCTQTVNTVVNNDSDIFAVDYEVAKYYANLQPDKVKTIKLNLDDKELENKLIIGPYTIYVRKGNDALLEKINKGIRKALYRDYEGKSLYLPDLEAKLKELQNTSNPDPNKVNDLKTKIKELNDKYAKWLELALQEIPTS
ncbi:substrate-binding periplasmic protein [Candidatus Phytoplasma pruni]|uniref:Transporter substrate-binding domain-containing protein n=1 Tax=Candidatus Phytoplasma pruni TaxID=479893 RepID=A0A851HFY0_9MOLU|nr:transporter substrate-binding domain-containing protein [Candidatus Phytoplasma pruni]NWN45540.1 transporter substrate-binding domain-containing protein [Candidatus Phytoplasma pruni]